MSICNGHYQQFADEVLEVINNDITKNRDTPSEENDSTIRMTKENNGPPSAYYIEIDGKLTNPAKILGELSDI